MRPVLLLAFLALPFAPSIAQKGKVLLPNGWTLCPAGREVILDADLPLNMAIAPNGKYLGITNNGVGKQSIQLVDARSFRLLSTTTIPKSWLGLKFTSDSKYLYASGGNDNRINKYLVAHDSLQLVDSIILGKKWPVKISPAGLEIDDAADRMYAVTKEDNKLYVIDLAGKQIVKTLDLSAEAYTCLLSPDKKMLYISLWGGSKLLRYDTRKELITDSLTIGRNPNDLTITHDGKTLFVANSVDNTVSVLDAASFKVIETLNAAMFPDAPSGSTTNSVALDKKEKTLYIANADNNCIAVFDVSERGHSRSLGFIPTGWYPTCVRVIGNNIVVTNGKGNTSLPNPLGPQPVQKGEKDNYKKANKNSDQYIGGLMHSTMNIIPVPNETELGEMSKQVYANTPYTKARETESVGEAGNPIPMKIGEPSPIKHVFYIMKENRTYDQVLADMPKGNGDTSLLLFGRNVTPNLHAIADEYVLLDNFYVDAEVSADGHNWSMAAYANDYVEKTWPTNYSGRGGTYDYAAKKPVATPKAGFLWDYAVRKGITFRDYGEFTDDDGTVYLPDLAKHMCPHYPGWDLKIKDTYREKVWEHDFDSLVKANAVPQLNIVYLPSDHTAGLGKKSRTPYAYVADNDLAVGQLLEHLSHSSVWKDCAVFVLEDDAQNGPDHVDAHRSTAFVAGPFVKRRYVDNTMYSTTGMLRTIELILGLPPMSQYDAGATPMFRCFTPQADARPYNHKDESIDMDQLNTAGILSDRSQHLDLSSADRIPDMELNELLWRSIKPTTPLPAPKRAAFVVVSGEKDED